ncbi:family 10 glycosylhydrolase [bacterium]|nr:family 10 glycosylhydrolase [bacterium]
MMLRLLFSALLMALIVGAPAQNAPPSEEMRAVFVNRFEWPGGTSKDVEKRLSTIFSTLEAGNFNTVILQVRGQGDTFYPSKDEPWSASASSSLRGSDPVRFALKQAQASGLQLHAWINLSTIWQSTGATLPKDSKHPLYRFANAAKPDNCLGLIHDANGKPKQFGADGYVWLTSGNPEVNAYLRRQVENFLDAYPVQGLVWDDRTGLPNGVSRDPVSVRRHAGRGNPAKISSLRDWQLDQLSRFLSDIYVSAKSRNPRLMVTAAPFGIADKSRIPGYNRFSDGASFGVEPEKWLRYGIVDALMPQVYWDEPDPAPNFSVVARDWHVNNKSGRPIWPASALAAYGKAGKQTIDPWQARYVGIARDLKSGGNAFYNWSGATPAEWKSAATLMYTSKAKVPVPAHMKQPVGQIMGFIRNPAGEPVIDCWVKTDKSSYIHLTSGDGFFGIPNLAPGKYTLSWAWAEGQFERRDVVVPEGATVKLELTTK